MWMKHITVKTYAKPHDLSSTIILLSNELKWLTFFVEFHRRSHLLSPVSSGQTAANKSATDQVQR